MREIKFRAWDKRAGKMVTVWDISWTAWDSPEEDINYVRVECGNGTYDLADNFVVLMQYTGLKDKNGKEIYEGDIIKHRPLDRPNDDLLYGIHELLLGDVGQVVEYEGGRFNPISRWHSIDDLQYEVVGNIYENPGFLK